jgi:hypothetical protein
MTHQDGAPYSSNHPDGDPGELHYDSFVIRIWHHRGNARFTRAEVRHVQPGQASTATDVGLDWVASAISGFLDGGQPHEGRPEDVPARQGRERR